MQQLSTESSGAIFSKNRYIEYRPGTLNVIISAPHGGQRRPSHIPNRDFGSIVHGQRVFDHNCIKDPSIVVRTKADIYTKELALALSNVLQRKTGHRPHVILSHLHRRKLDCNADRNEATFDIPEVVDAWLAFHEFIDEAKSKIGRAGLYIDIHGHGHSEKWIELGYSVPGKKLNAGDYQANETSIRRLHENLLSRGCRIGIQELISGPQSFGGILAAADSFTGRVVPSPEHAGPGSGQFFSGGYNVIRHGSRYGGEIDGIQIESPIERRMSPEREKYAEAVGATIVEFLRLYYS